MSRRRHLFTYLAARLALVPLMLWLTASLVFLLLRVAPGDPIDALLGTRAPREAREALRQQLGLDQPLLSQYGHYLNDLLHGQLGQSLTNQEPVSTVIGRSLPASLELGLVALLIAAVIGLAVGFSGIARPEGKVDLTARLYGIGTYALPPFWAAMVVQLVFAVWLGWLPVGGRFPPTLVPPEGSGFYLLDSLRHADLQQFSGALRHLVLPASTLALLLSGIARVLHYGQGSDFYTENPLFWWKVGLYLGVGGLSLYPTVTYILWALPLRRGELPQVSEALAQRLRWILNIELAGFAAIPLIATLMARGVGLSG